MNDQLQNQEIPLPDWRSDWLYTLIFREVEQHWQMCERLADPEYERYVLVEEWSSVKEEMCCGTVIRAWVRNENGMNEISLEEHSQHIDILRAIRRTGLPAFFPFVQFEFHIYPDRQFVTLGYYNSTRSGEGDTYRIDGIMENATLVFARAGWIS